MDCSVLIFGIWVLVFKPGTHAKREASSLVLIRPLIEAGAKVRANDPVAKYVARSMFSVD